MEQNLPSGCSIWEVDASDPFSQVVGICANCEADIFAEDEALTLANGMICARCLTEMQSEDLAELLAALAPTFWGEAELAKLLAEYTENGRPTQ